MPTGMARTRSCHPEEASRPKKDLRKRFLPHILRFPQDDKIGRLSLFSPSYGYRQ